MDFIEIELESLFEKVINLMPKNLVTKLKHSTTHRTSFRHSNCRARDSWRKSQTPSCWRAHSRGPPCRRCICSWADSSRVWAPPWDRCCWSSRTIGTRRRRCSSSRPSCRCQSEWLARTRRPSTDNRPWTWSSDWTSPRDNIDRRRSSYTSSSVVTRFVWRTKRWLSQLAMFLLSTMSSDFPSLFLLVLFISV